METRTDTRSRVERGAEAAAALLGLPSSARDAALDAIIEALGRRRAEIFEANRADLDAGRAAGLPAPLMKRLAFDERKLAEVLAGAKDLRAAKDPVGRVMEARLLDDGLVLRKVSCPIGLVAMIFESRPDALVQMACLAARSGNAIVVKGGSEALHSNRVLAAVIAEAGESAGLPPGWLTALETRAEIAELLVLHDLVDLVIPRGSKEFVARIMATSRIPVLGHSDGVCHVYAHADADPAMAARIALDSKTQYPAACNAAEVLLADAAFAERHLAEVLAPLVAAGVRLDLCERSAAILQAQAPGLAASDLVGRFQGDDWSVEYLDLRMAVRVVDGLGAAIRHVNRYGSGHTDAIVTSSDAAARAFMLGVDSSSVYRNASTRFADGYRYGLGAEVGISTGKIHARGPMGVDGLLTYKWQLEGTGQVVADYVSGEASFKHIDIDPDAVEAGGRAGDARDLAGRPANNRDGGDNG